MPTVAGIFFFFAVVARVHPDVAAGDAGGRIGGSAARALHERGHILCVLRIRNKLHILLQHREERVHESLVGSELVRHKGGGHWEAALTVRRGVELRLDVHDGEEPLGRACGRRGLAHDAEVYRPGGECGLHSGAVREELHFDGVRKPVRLKNGHERIFRHSALPYAPDFLAGKVGGLHRAFRPRDHIKDAAGVGTHKLIFRTLHDEVDAGVGGHDDDVSVPLRHMRPDLVGGHDVDLHLIPRHGEGILLRNELRHRECGRAVGDIELECAAAAALFGSRGGVIKHRVEIAALATLIVAGGKPHRKPRDQRERQDHDQQFFCHSFHNMPLYLLFSRYKHCFRSFSPPLQRR